jgi:hypothetical protein
VITETAWNGSELASLGSLCMNNSSVDVIFASSQSERESARSRPRRRRMRRFSRRTAAGWIFDWALCMRVTHITHSGAFVSVCEWVRALSSGALIYFGYLMLLGALGFNYSRAPHLPPPEIYRRETLRFITATPGCVKFQRCRQSAARFATAHLLFDKRVHGVVHTHTRAVGL